MPAFTQLVKRTGRAAIQFAERLVRAASSVSCVSLKANPVIVPFAGAPSVPSFGERAHILRRQLAALQHALQQQPEERQDALDYNAPAQQVLVQTPAGLDSFDRDELLVVFLQSMLERERAMFDRPLLRAVMRGMVEAFVAARLLQVQPQQPTSQQTMMTTTTTTTTTMVLLLLCDILHQDAATKLFVALHRCAADTYENDQPHIKPVSQLASNVVLIRVPCCDVATAIGADENNDPARDGSSVETAGCQQVPDDQCIVRRQQPWPRRERICE